MSISLILCIVATGIFGYKYFKERNLTDLGLSVFALSFCLVSVVFGK